jgi:hypothetical protein
VRREDESSSAGRDVDPDQGNPVPNVRIEAIEPPKSATAGVQALNKDADLKKPIAKRESADTTNARAAKPQKRFTTLVVCYAPHGASVFYKGWHIAQPKLSCKIQRFRHF